MPDNLEKPLENFRRTLALLEEALSQPVEDRRDVAGTIQCFEMAFETGWKAAKVYLAHQGIEVASPRATFSKLNEAQVFDDEELLMAMLDDRNLTVHTYSEELANAIVGRIRDRYATALAAIYDAISASGSEPDGAL